MIQDSIQMSSGTLDEVLKISPLNVNQNQNVDVSSIQFFPKPKIGVLANAYHTAPLDQKALFCYQVDFHTQALSNSEGPTRLLHTFTILQLYKKSELLKNLSKLAQKKINCMRNFFRREGQFQSLCDLFDKLSFSSDDTRARLNAIETSLETYIAPTNTNNESDETLDSLCARFLSLLEHDQTCIEAVIVLCQFIRLHKDYPQGQHHALMDGKNMKPYRIFIEECARFFGHNPENLNTQSIKGKEYEDLFRTGLVSLKAEYDQLKKTNLPTGSYKLK